MATAARLLALLHDEEQDDFSAKHLRDKGPEASRRQLPCPASARSRSTSAGSSPAASTNGDKSWRPASLLAGVFPCPAPLRGFEACVALEAKCCPIEAPPGLEKAKAWQSQRVPLRCVPPPPLALPKIPSSVDAAGRFINEVPGISVPAPPSSPPVLPSRLLQQAPEALSQFARLPPPPPALPPSGLPDHLQQSVPPAPTVPAPGVAAEPAEVRTVGSSRHSLGLCKPCAFFHTKGCAGGFQCVFCHLCPPGEKKRRQKAKHMAKGGHH